MTRLALIDRHAQSRLWRLWRVLPPEAWTFLGIFAIGLTSALVTWWLQ